MCGWCFVWSLRLRVRVCMLCVCVSTDGYRVLFCSSVSNVSLLFIHSVYSVVVKQRGYHTHTESSTSMFDHHLFTSGSESAALWSW